MLVRRKTGLHIPFLRKSWVKVTARVILFLVSMCVFVFALFVMKEGARPLTPFIRNHLSVDSPASALGFGWLGASLALSGSPVAATALSLLDGQVLSVPETFAMISGSRLGAAFVVLLIGFIYLIRGKQRDVSLNIGLTSLLVTQSIYPAVILLGSFFIYHGWFNSWQVAANQELSSPIEQLLQPLVNLLVMKIHPGILFPAGFLLVMASLFMFDQAIPELNLKETELGLVHHLLYRPIVTFLLGAVITTLTMSVSVSLSLLVPLSVRGFIRQENAIPYILGANITTFVDTLIAAALLGNAAGVSVVLIQMISVTIVSVILLLTLYRTYERFLQHIVRFIGRRRRYVLSYLLLILGIPFLLLWLG
jgi:sodium-dependent phosphate cotransporter